MLGCFLYYPKETHRPPMENGDLTLSVLILVFAIKPNSER